MNEKEIAEIRRRFNPDKSNITHIRGCYVNEKREIVSEFNQSLGLMSQEESEEILAVLKRTLSGTVGKNLIDIAFTTQQVIDGEEHKLLTDLRNSSLNDEIAVQMFFQKIIQTLVLEGNYLILLAHDTYDIKEKQDDSSTGVFSYILCSICPTKMTKPALSYYTYENRFRNIAADWIVAAPELGFMFPAFDDRSANIYNAVYYSRNIAENHSEFIDAVFKSDIPMTAAAQKETFRSILEETIADDCSYEVVQTIHEQLCEMVTEYKTNKETDLPVISKITVKDILESCGVSEPRMTAFDKKYTTEFGADSEINIRNIVDTKQFEVRTPDVTIRVSQDHSDLIETRIIDGVKYILIRADTDVEVNGVNINISR